ncbi:MAG: response regulator transcription factor [Deltaproteobacteria bacterium]|nr:response regulator transcription factor [Deltaproteobacteria bacterium]
MSGILIADNELALAAKLESFLLEKGYDMVGIAVSGRQAVSMALDMKPDLVLMEIKLTGEMDGITAAKKIKSLMDTPIVFVTWYGDEKNIEKAGHAHPGGYVLKPYRPSQVQAAIEIALSKNNRKTHHEERQDEETDELLADDTRRRTFGALTPAEIRVANLVKDGKRTRDIARQLKLAQSTVSWHRKNIRRKIGVTGNKTRNLMGNLSILSSLFPFVNP